MTDIRLTKDVWAVEQFLLSNPLHMSRDVTDRFWRVLATLSAETVRADTAESKLDKIQAVVVDALANADDSEVGWDAEISASALHEILEDS